MSEANPHPRYNLLTQPLIRTEAWDGTQDRRSLPGVLAALASGEGILGFPGLQPHQWPSFHAFSVQLAVHALEDEPGAPPETETAWEHKLRRLTPDDEQDEPWCLVVPELERPAFLQPPVPEGSLFHFNGPYSEPDARAIDLLVTSTHHDVKAGRQVCAEADQWLFSLIAYQTFSGYYGSGYRGVIRMANGTASRPLVGLAWSAEWTDLFRRDLSILRAHHQQARQAKELGQDGWRLLWLRPWDGQDSIPWAECDPYAIEIARRVRLAARQGRLEAWQRTTAVTRLKPNARELKGHVGDPWIPVTKDRGTAVNLNSSGWSYDWVQKVLLGSSYLWSACQTPREDDPEALWFYAVGLAGAQGKTEGFHERWIPIPPAVARRLSVPESRQELVEIAEERLQRVRGTRNALKRALEALPGSDGRWLDALEREVDTLFFEQLWADVDHSREEQRASWDRTLRALIEARIWPQAERDAPIPEARRERARDRARRILHGRLKQTIPDAYNKDAAEEPDATC